MKNTKNMKLFFFILITILLLSNVNYSFSNEITQKGIILENFDDGEVMLSSFTGEDQEPSYWTLISYNTYNSSAYSLNLYGNTWKVEEITPVYIDSSSILQIAAYVESIGEIQGFGVMDSLNYLLYSFAGTEEVNPNDWISVYQGAFPTQTWNLYQLPIADDWLAKYGYLPTITSLIYINDRDYGFSGEIYFDEIEDISIDLPIAPIVNIGYYPPSKIYLNNNNKSSIDVQFYSEIIDTNSIEHSYYWDFGDDSISTEANPLHTFIIEDDHLYTIRLEVMDDTGQWGYGICKVSVGEGESTFPIKMNFIGDIMLARKYEDYGGIIPTYGVEHIFEPTLNILGEAADITVANLECPLSNTGIPHPTKSVVFRSAPANVSGLVYAGIDIVTLANNHIIDYGFGGLQQTQDVLDDNDILYSGAGINSYEAYLPLFYSKAGVNIAFLAFSDRTGQYNNYQPYLNAGYNKVGFANLTEYDLSKQIDNVEDFADIIIVEMHSGREYHTAPSKYIEELEDEDYSPLYTTPKSSDIAIRRLAIDEGADVVICHHPHITQGFEVYEGKLIAHSLGNFVFDLDYPETFPTVILNSKINEMGFYEHTITPIYIDDYIPVRAEGELGLYILNYLSMLSRDLGTYIRINRKTITGEIILEPTMEIYEQTYETQFQLTENTGNWFSEPIKLVKEGNISSIDDITALANKNDWSYRLGRDVIWWGNFEDEGCTLWEIDSDYERYDDTEAFRGLNSMCQQTNTHFPYITTHLEKRIQCDIDKNYSLYGHIKTQNANEVTIKARYYDTRTYDYNLGTEDIGTFVYGDSDWQFYHKELTLPEWTKYFNIRLNSRIPEFGTGYAWFDDVGVIEWGEWQSADILPQNIINPNDYYYIQFKTDTEVANPSFTYTETNYSSESTLIENEPFTQLPQTFQLYQNYPNPFNPMTTISYQLAETMQIDISIYNIMGQLVKTLVNEEQEAGYHTIVWDGKNQDDKPLPSGVYLYRIKSDDYQDTKKMLIMK